jgi:hypothetical protein
MFGFKKGELCVSIFTSSPILGNIFQRDFDSCIGANEKYVSIWPYMFLFLSMLMS